MKKHTEIPYQLLFIAIGVFLAAAFEKASRLPQNETGSLFGFNFNLIVYVGILAAAFVIFAAAAFVISRMGRAGAGNAAGTPKGIASLFLYVIYGAASAALFLLIYKIYTNEVNLYPGNAAPTYLRQEVNHRVYFLIICLIAAVLFLTLSREERKENRPFRVGLAAIFALLNALPVWLPNFLADRGGGMTHIHAVLNSIVNVARLKPYNELNCSIYGHYSLIFLPFVRLFGSNLTAIFIALLLFTFLAFFAAFYAADKLVKRDDLYLITLAAITGTTTILTRRGAYLQINPLRLLFPFVTLALIAYGEFGKRGRDSKTVRILEYITGILSVIWNFETGLFCVAVIALIRIYRSLCGSPLLSRNTLRALGGAVLFGIVSLAGAYGVVNLYNLLTGGSVNSVRLFIYPLFSGTYNVNNLRVPLPGIRFLYFFQILLFFLAALRSLLIVLEGKGEDRGRNTLIFAVALSGLSSLIYFINRAAYGNMSIAHAQMVLLLAAFGQYALHLTKENWKRELMRPAIFLRSAVSVILFGGLVWMAIEGALYLVVCYDYRANSTWKTEEFDQVVAEIQAAVPENTYGFGFAIPELWYHMGWDNMPAMTDWSDMNDYNRSYAYEEALKRDAFVASGMTLEFEGYEETPITKVGENEVIYYVKK